MKGPSKLWRLLAALSVAGLAGLSCTKEIGRPGGGIQFSAHVGGTSTRTSYSGEGTSSGGHLTKERIDWTDGDLMTVYSPQAVMLDGTTHVSDYRVKSHVKLTGNLISRATVDPADKNGLQWGSGDHTFYAMYPSAATSGFTTAEKEKVSLTGTQMTGTIPSSQSLTWDGQRGMPQMRYAYMFATASCPVNTESVNLPYYPQFTAFEFQIGSGKNAKVELTSFTLTAATGSNAVAGDFAYAIEDVNTSVSGDPLALDKFTFSNISQSITVSFTGLTGGKLTVLEGKPVTFTVLALPQELTGLSISFTGEQIGTRTLKLNDNSGNALTFSAREKHLVHGLSFPKILTTTEEDVIWDTETLLEGLIWDNN